MRFVGLNNRLIFTPESLNNDRFFVADGTTTDKQEIYKSCISELVMPSVGEEIKVKITCVESINQFYIQMEEERG